MYGLQHVDGAYEAVVARRARIERIQRDLEHLRERAETVEEAIVTGAGDTQTEVSDIYIY